MPAENLPIASLAAEVRSVNGRFLDVQFRLPTKLRPWNRRCGTHPDARGPRQGGMPRFGHSPANATPRINVNEGLLLELAEVSRKVRAAVPDARPLSVGEVLGWPGVLGDDRSARCARLALRWCTSSWRISSRLAPAKAASSRKCSSSASSA